MDGSPKDEIAIGTITEVHGPVATIACKPLPPLGRALRAIVEQEPCLFEVHQQLDAGRVRAIAMHDTGGMQRGTPVYDTGAALQVPVSTACLGRLLNLFGEPLDGGALLEATAFSPIRKRPVPLRDAIGTGTVLETGIKVVDLLCPFVKGGKTGLFGGAGVGKNGNGACAMPMASARAKT
jgi:F-type H+-transporting ATPase subunit beta